MPASFSERTTGLLPSLVAFVLGGLSVWLYMNAAVVSSDVHLHALSALPVPAQSASSAAIAAVSPCPSFSAPASFSQSASASTAASASTSTQPSFSSRASALVAQTSAPQQALSFEHLKQQSTAGARWCDSSTTGRWRGLSEPYEFVLDESADSCVWPVNSVSSALRVLSGARLLFIGDSMTRELLFDLLRAITGCGTTTVRDTEVKAKQRYDDSDVLAPRTQWARHVCAHINDGSKRTIDIDFVVPLDPLFPDLGNATFSFRWLARIGGLGGWAKMLTDATQFDIVTIGSFHWFRDDKKPAREERYLGEVQRVVDALTAAGPARLQKRLFWRSPPLSRWPVLDPSAFTTEELGKQDMVNNYFLVPLANAAMKIWGNAGFRVLNFSKYFVHENCTEHWTPTAPDAEACPLLSTDGAHPAPSVNLVMMRELLSTALMEGMLPFSRGARE